MQKYTFPSKSEGKNYTFSKDLKSRRVYGIFIQINFNKIDLNKNEIRVYKTIDFHLIVA